MEVGYGVGVAAAAGAGTGTSTGVTPGTEVGGTVRVDPKYTAVGSGTGVGVRRVMAGVRTTTTFRSRFIFTVAMVSLPVSTPFHAIPYPAASG